MKWIVGSSDGEVFTSEGDYICTAHGNTLGEVIDRANLIAAAPELKDQLEEALDRLRDILKADDGQAYKEAQKFLDRIGK